MPTLHRIYTVYFPWEPCNSMHNAEIQQKSLKATFEILKDFDVSPTLLTKSLAFLLFNDLVDTPVELVTGFIVSSTPYEVEVTNL